MIVQCKGEEHSIRILNVLEFDSARKRMTVIVRLANGTIRALIKGADSAIFDILSDRTDEVRLNSHALL